MYYQELIQQILDALGLTADPRHVEAYMRLEYGTLDHLSRADFRREAKVCVQCIREGGTDAAESLAASYAL